MNTLLRQLVDQACLVQAYLDVLEQEADLLGRNAYLALEVLSRRKSEVADRLAAADRAREAQLAVLGLTEEVAAEQGGPRVAQAWRRLMDLAKEAREKNHRNGVMIHAHLEYTRQAISFISSGSRPLYGPDGSHHLSNGMGMRRAAG